jgi:hypothetical protein
MISTAISSEPLKISVLASGDLLLDGNPVMLRDLGYALHAARERGAGVWYYREAADQEPPPSAGEVMKMIVENRLPVKLCVRPDFTDVPGPEAAFEQVFATARRRAAAQRALQIVLADGRCRAMAAPAPGSVPERAVKSVEGLVPPGVQRNVVVIGNTEFAAQEGAGISDAGKAIPFFGMLIGLCYIGHAVVIFEGHKEALAAACREGDVLILDSAMLAHLEKGWDKAAQEAMRNPNILVHDRKSFKLMIVRSAGETKGKIEFPR